MNDSSLALPAIEDFPELAEELARHAVSGDERNCALVLERALKAPATILDVYQDLLGASMRNVGEWFHKGEVNIAGEHMASEITEELMQDSLRHFGRAERNGLSALLGGGPESWHVIGLRMMTNVLRHRGWNAMYLGPNVPILSFVETVRVNRPDLVLLTCNARESIPGTLTLIRALAGFRSDVPDAKAFLIGIGGMLAAPNLATFLEAGADFTNLDLRSFVAGTVADLERENPVQVQQIPPPTISRQKLNFGLLGGA